MTTLEVWVTGARPRTLPAAIAPILAGAATAAAQGEADLLLTVLAFLVAAALQVGVNYANDYSDGVRGTDEFRTGPTRITASGLARPAAVKRAAFLSFGAAAVFGLVIVVLTAHWWLLAVGVAAILAAWFYTGGEKPYGYMGLGEVFVFIFFGLVATMGTAYIVADRFAWYSVAAGSAVGAMACAVLVGNNLRDIPTDRETGKRTLAVRLGDRGTRVLYVALAVLAVVSVVAFAAGTTWWALVALLGLLPLGGPLRLVLSGAVGRDLIPVIQGTGLAGVGIGLGLLVGVYLA
ncbi:1,4-dihydroxy-2-naphthoate polyprenyltransferase [Tessaracoccus oleiagri]|uniref:1,4-dihydroxy-2-naphthoate octaprenyltransferase n=1 Tax=Tessaracoccus oleiagri TaxID=686624 RepID=A0A1G9KLW8_9ACTN|nr:1,4-dihydroxy-2-naphthoate polyprenyltransferase [Tessaracoccus oleiagri]SDL50423.1 1,4-dihydroxy-2-naphthoate prenyltransferase [Tessaracoccus oleiagri]